MDGWIDGVGATAAAAAAGVGGRFGFVGVGVGVGVFRTAVVGVAIGVDLGADVSVGAGVAGVACVAGVGGISRQEGSNRAGQQQDGTTRQTHTKKATKLHGKTARLQKCTTTRRQHNNPAIHQPIDVARRNARSA